MAATRHLTFAHSDRRKRPYWRDKSLLGKQLIDQYQEQILVIGKDTWTRQEIVDHLHCGNFVAAQNLSKIASKLQVDSLDQLTTRFTMEDLFAESGFGITTMFVLMCAQEAKQKNPLAWVDRPADKVVTLATEKHRILKQRAERVAAQKKTARERNAKKHAAAS